MSGDYDLKSLKMACVGIFLILLFTSVPVFADCDECKDLCKLMDVYMQREEGIGLWKEYAASTPDEEKGRYSSYIKGTGEIENFVMSEFQDWANNRKANNQLPILPAKFIGLSMKGKTVKGMINTDTRNLKVRPETTLKKMSVARHSLTQ
jgi:hypothetical protein